MIETAGMKMHSITHATGQENKTKFKGEQL